MLTTLAVRVAIEKYFGHGLYASLEVWQRQSNVHLALFADWRLFKNHLDIHAGAVDLKSMLFEQNKFAFTLAPPKTGTFYVKPGFLVGITFHGRFGIGKSGGLSGIEDRLGKIDASIEKLRGSHDTLATRVDRMDKVLATTRDTLHIMADTMFNDPSRVSNIITDKVISLKNMLAADPFEPEKVKLLSHDIMSYRDKAVRTLSEIAADETQDRGIRSVAVGLLGTMKATGASSVLMNALSRSQDPGLRVDIIIALGKLRELRAQYILEQLCNDPDDAVAMTAQEILNGFVRQSGIVLSPGLKMRTIDTTTVEVIKPRTPAAVIDSTQKQAPSALIQKVQADMNGIPAAKKDSSASAKDTSKAAPAKDSIATKPVKQDSTTKSAPAVGGAAVPAPVKVDSSAVATKANVDTTKASAPAAANSKAAAADAKKAEKEKKAKEKKDKAAADKSW